MRKDKEPYLGGEGDIGLERAEEMDPATGTLTEGDIGISGETVPFKHEGAAAPSKVKKMWEMVKKFVKARMPYKKALARAATLFGIGIPEAGGRDEIIDLLKQPGERKFPKNFDWDKIPRDKWKDPGFPGPPKVHPDAPQVGHHFDINPLQTMEFRDRNQDGIEDRSQGIYDQPRDLIPWEFDKSRKWRGIFLQRY